ncbi:Protein of unknown function [Gryllus bimaculatus]|nr:Protein of unknown function [Gryllus bimaculatus]
MGGLGATGPWRAKFAAALTALVLIAAADAAVDVRAFENQHSQNEGNPFASSERLLGAGLLALDEGRAPTGSTLEAPAPLTSLLVLPRASPPPLPPPSASSLCSYASSSLPPPPPPPLLRLHSISNPAPNPTSTSVSTFVSVSASTANSDSPPPTQLWLRPCHRRRW